jgi:hypothetical protein
MARGLSGEKIEKILLNNILYFLKYCPGTLTKLAISKVKKFE